MRDNGNASYSEVKSLTFPLFLARQDGESEESFKRRALAEYEVRAKNFSPDHFNVLLTHEPIAAVCAHSSFAPLFAEGIVALTQRNTHVAVVRLEPRRPLDAPRRLIDPYFSVKV